MPALFVALAGLHPEMFRCFQRAFTHEAQAVAAKVIEQRGSLFEEHRQVVLDAGGGAAFLHVLIQRAAARIDGEALAQQTAEVTRGFFIERKFACRQQPDCIHFVQRALGFRVEGADRIHVLVQQFDAIRLGAAHREDVQQRATHGEVARIQHLRHVAITRRFQPALLVFQRQALALFHHQCLACDESRRSQPLHQGGDRHHQHAATHGRQPIQRGHTARDDVRLRAEQVVRQGFPIRERQHRKLRREHGKLGFQRVRGMAVAGDGNQHPVVRLCSAGNHQRQGTETGWRAPVGTLLTAVRQGWVRNGVQRKTGVERAGHFTSAPMRQWPAAFCRSGTSAAAWEK